MALAARAALASVGAGAGIQAELEAEAVDVIGECLHTGRETLRIRDDIAVGIAVHLPAVVDDDVFVAGVGHAGGGHRIGHLLDELLADVAAELVPGVPAHRRRGREAAVQGIGKRLGLFLGSQAQSAQQEEKGKEMLASHSVISGSSQMY